MLAAVYARFSSDAQRDVSIEIQVEKCTKFIKSQGWTLGECYCDYAKTGRNDKRPAFQRAMNDAQEHAYDVLVVYKNDRFARNIEISRKYKRLLSSCGIAYASVYEGGIVNDEPASFLHNAMDDVLSEYYSLNLSRMVRNGIERNAAHCKTNGRRIYGYTRDKNDKYVIDEQKAQVVKLIFELACSGRSFLQIANHLNDSGVPSPRNSLWCTATVSKILKNVAYKGVYDYNGHVVEDAIPAIIDKDMFEAIQARKELLKMKARAYKYNDYILTSRLYCYDCGDMMSGVSGYGKAGKKYRYYKCINKKCNNCVPADKLEDKVLTELKDIMHCEENVEDMCALVVDYAKTVPDKSSELKDEIAMLEKKFHALCDTVSDTSGTLISKELQSIENKVEELNDKLRFEEFKHKTLTNEEDIRNIVEQVIKISDATPERTELFLSSFLECVYVNKDTVVIDFAFNKRTAGTVSFDEIKKSFNDLQKQEDFVPEGKGVRVRKLWWAKVLVTRTLFVCGGRVFSLLKYTCNC